MELVGTWRLKSCLAESRSGKKFLPYGENPIGQLIYTNEGRMSVFLMKKDRESFTSNDLDQATTIEKARAFDSFDAYAGRYSIDLAAGTVIHHIEMARIVNWLNEAHLRFFKIKGDTLYLTTEPFIMGGEDWQVHVEWGRLTEAAP